MSAKQAIENALKPLIGLALVHTSRAANMQCLHFSSSAWEDRDASGSCWSLHIQCPWRLSDGKSILVGDADLYQPVEEDAPYDESFDYDVKGGNLRDVKLATLLQGEALTVEAVVADPFGGFEMRFQKSHVLSVFPTLTRKHDYGEYWRVFDFAGKSAPHFVTSAQKVSRL